jgi:hypothetical protein
MAPLLLYLTQSASETYESLTFKTDAFYNEPPPEPWVSFVIGGFFSVLGFVYWIFRVRQLKRDFNVTQLTHSLRFRVWISAFIDNDAPMYTILKMAAQSFLFLGGLQHNYELAFSVMLGFFGLESSLDSLRVLIAFHEATSLRDVVVASESLKASCKDLKHITQLKPNNVYEDLSRDKMIIFMVFITQGVLIAFVVSVSSMNISFSLSFFRRFYSAPRSKPSPHAIFLGYRHFLRFHALLSGWNGRLSCRGNSRLVGYLRSRYFHGMLLSSRPQDQLWTIGAKSCLLAQALACGENQRN